MDSIEFNNRILAIADKIKNKGWESASIDINVSYLVIFRDPGPFDPIIQCRPSIRASTRDRNEHPTSHNFVRDLKDIKTIEDAVTQLEVSADAMPSMADETARVENAKGKLSDDERRLLGIR